MGAQRTSFEKLQRDRAKKAKAAAKRERRQDRSTAPASDGELTVDEETGTDDELGELSAADLLRAVEMVHKRFDAKMISYEEFEEKKAELLGRLPID